MIHLDTTFLVDLLREQRRDRFGPASTYLEGLPDDELLAVSVHVVCELMAGAMSSRAPSTELDRVTRLCAALVVQFPDHRFAPAYGRLLAKLDAAGTTMPTMDLLIGTAAMLDDAPLVTRNARHLQKIPGLTVHGY